MVVCGWHMKESGIDPWMVVPHGSYLLNCGSSDDEVLRKTRETLIDELKRCEKLGLPIYNFHPGLSSLVHFCHHLGVCNCVTLLLQPAEFCDSLRAEFFGIDSRRQKPCTEFLKLLCRILRSLLAIHFTVSTIEIDIVQSCRS